MPNQIGPVAPGFDSNRLAANDDGSTGSIALPFAANFFGTTYNSLFVNNNGNVTFSAPSDGFSPFGLAAYRGQPIIAAFYSDVDTRGPDSGIVSYGTGVYNGHTAFGVTYPGVGYYHSHTNHLNTFQILLTDRSETGAGNFDIYLNYNSITWETGDVDGGSNGFGGNSAAVGFSNGVANPTYFQFDGSRTPGALIDGGPNALASHTNDGVNGQYLFEVRNGQVLGGGQPPPPPRPELHPVAFGLGGLEPHREGDEGVTPFTALITRSGSDLSGGSTVHWEIRIQDPSDLVAGQTLSGDVDFGPGQTVASVDVGVQGDHIFEGDDWFQFLVTSASHGGVTWDPGLIGTAIIRNDDSPVTFSGPVMRPEGAAGASPFEFLVMRTGDATAQLTLTWNLELNGSANSQDLDPSQALTGTLTLAAGATQGLITINVRGDVLPELDEVFTLRLVQATTNGSTTVLDVSTTATILDDDVRTTLLISSPSATVLPEGDVGQTAFNFNVMRVGDLTIAAHIPYTISLPAAGATSFAEIQTPITGFVDFAVGSTQATLTVLIAADTTAEDNEGFIVTLGGAEGFNALVVNGLILNDDKFAATVAAPAHAVAAFTDADVSSFFSHLAGGSLWADAGAI